jgi:hypothetical protein
MIELNFDDFENTPLYLLLHVMQYSVFELKNSSNVK